MPDGNVTFTVKFPQLDNTSGNLVVKAFLYRHRRRDRNNQAEAWDNAEGVAVPVATDPTKTQWTFQLYGPSPNYTRAAASKGHWLTVRVEVRETVGGGRKRTIRRITRLWPGAT